MRQKLAAKAFAHTAQYDAMICAYFTGAIGGAAGTFPDDLNLSFRKHLDLRYGENPHQQAAFYTDPRAIGASVTQARQIQGKELSYNNIADSDTALECVRQFEAPACVIVKHANPAAWHWDPRSAAPMSAPTAPTPPRLSAASLPSTANIDAATARMIRGSAVRRSHSRSRPASRRRPGRCLRPRTMSACSRSAICPHPSPSSWNTNPSPAGSWCRRGTPAKCGPPTFAP